MDAQQWNGKKWYCYGTSMTDNRDWNSEAGRTPDNEISKPAKTGWYPQTLAELSGLEMHNFGKAGSGIVPSQHDGDNIKTRVMTLDDGKAEADLITVEIIPNDSKAPLGEVTDWSDDTFCGNLNQILAYLLSNTKAFVAVLIATRARYYHLDPAVRYDPASQAALERLEREEAVEKICKLHGVPCWNGAAEACLGYYRMGNTCEYVADQIHLTEKGGRILGQYFWGKLKNVYPIK